MKILKIVSLVFVVTVGLVASVHAQGLTDGILVNIPHEVVVNKKVIPAGEYEIRKVTNNVNTVLRFFNRDEMMYETPALPISTEKPQVVEEQKVVMQKIGDEYYLTEVWLQPDRVGYQIPLPSRARALQQELERAGH